MNHNIVELNGNALGDEYLKMNFEHFYAGHLIDEPDDSFANGILLNKQFFGTIKSQKLGNYYIEPAKRFSNDSTDDESIMYNEKHVRPEKILKKRSVISREDSKSEPETGSCAYEKVKKWMNTEQKNIFEEKIKNEVIFERFKALIILKLKFLIA